MHRNAIGVSSAVAILALLAGYPAISNAHDDSELCNVLLDGDGEPVLESDSDQVGHSGSYGCEGDDDTASSADETEPAEEEEVEVAVVETPTVRLDPLTVYFDINRDDLSAGSDAEVKAFAEQLLATNPQSVEVVGYTDTSGVADLNEQLSKARASSVMAALIDAGVPASMVSSAASGEEDLAVNTPDGTREANNRRVTVTPQY